MSLYLGIDTSNYTTSFALSGDADKNVSQILPVKLGERGIRQSDGVFWHIKQAPMLYETLLEGIDRTKIRAVGVSTRPRSVEGSYMPVFLAGETFAELIANTLSVPLYRFSHQDGHIMAGVLSANREDLLRKTFCSVHLSGGTLEILRSRYDGNIFQSEIVGGTKDISAGQLIDRVGVKLGLSFPSGKDVSLFAKNADNAVKFSVSEKDGYINLSGAETQAMRLIGIEKAENICLGIIEAVAQSLIKALKSLGADDVLMVGGVASSDILRKILCKNTDIKFSFATPCLSCDNAWGTAKLTQMREGE